MTTFQEPAVAVSVPLLLSVSLPPGKARLRRRIDAAFHVG